MDTLERIVAACDLGSQEVIEAAVDLGRRLGSRVSLVHALDRETIDEMREELPGEAGYVDKLVARRRDELLGQVGRMYGEVPDFVDVEVLPGEPSDVIRRLAGDDRVSMIVIGRRLRSRVGKLLLGSVTQEILLGITKPVLTVAT